MEQGQRTHKENPPLLSPFFLPGSSLSPGSSMAGRTALKQTVAVRSPANTQLIRSHSSLVVLLLDAGSILSVIRRPYTGTVR